MYDSSDFIRDSNEFLSLLRVEPEVVGVDEHRRLYGAWVLGCLGAWVLGCLGAWVLGCLRAA
jgi:hypothetical protein